MYADDLKIVSQRCCAAAASAWDVFPTSRVGSRTSNTSAEAAVLQLHYGTAVERPRFWHTDLPSL